MLGAFRRHSNGYVKPMLDAAERDIAAGDTVAADEAFATADVAVAGRLGEQFRTVGKGLKFLTSGM
jgi:hypothetical protein